MEGMIVDISSQWLAIVLAAVIVWVASAIVWMVLPHHKKEFSKLPDEDGAANALRPQNLKPGQYAIPYCADMKDQAKPEMIEKYEKGPIALITVFPNGKPDMTKSLILSFIHYLFVGVIVAYVLSRTIHTPGVEYLTVFRLAGVVSWSAYGLAYIWQPIWFGMPWGTAIKHIADALLYALLTAGVFAWQWPG